MAFQDDSREEEMRQLFNLSKFGGRSDTDAVLNITHGGANIVVEFELKTTGDPQGSVTTVRDFGPEHIRKWKSKHWLFAFYGGSKVRYLYGSPKLLRPWIDEKESYIAPDFKLAELVSRKLSHQDLSAICGDFEKYSMESAIRIHKRQYSKEKYKSLMDLSDGYSRGRMLEILRERVEYIIRRGATLNNPHIPFSYFSSWTTEISSDHHNQLKSFVSAALNGEL
jgi:hypothetical protein